MLVVKANVQHRPLSPCYPAYAVHRMCILYQHSFIYIATIFQSFHFFDV